MINDDEPYCSIRIYTVEGPNGEHGRVVDLAVGMVVEIISNVLTITIKHT